MFAQGTWTQKADFGGTTRSSAIGFSIGTKGYIGTGGDGAGNNQDFWEWNQTSNTWTQKANFGGTARSFAIGFSIGNYGYIGTGADNSNRFQDFWEYYDSTSTVGINEIQNQISISVFPNPIAETATLRITNGTASNYEFKLYDVAGKEEQNICFSGRQLIFNKGILNTGIYFYKLTSPSPSGEGLGEVATGKLIIQ